MEWFLKKAREYSKTQIEKKMRLQNRVHELKHKNQIFSEGYGSFVSIFTVLKFAYIDLSYFIKKPDGIFFRPSYNSRDRW